MLAEMDMSDDWLAEAHPSTSHQAQHQVAQVEYSRLAEQFHAAGYREGIDKGKGKCLQEGFDQGFSAGAMVGRKLGLLRGRASATLVILLKLEEEDARVDRVRRLIRDLNRCDGGNLESYRSLDEEIEGLTNSMDGLMDPAGSGTREARPEREEVELLACCESEINAILASMGILAQSEFP